MNRSILLLPFLAAACAPSAEEPVSTEFAENIIEVPGFADFLQVDGDTVWTTNDGRVEQWSTTELLASVEIPRPCGTMAMAAGSLWVGNCEGGELYRIDPETAEVLAMIPAGIGPSGEQNVVAGAGAVWAPNQADGTISRIDPESDSIVASIEVATGTTFLAFGFDALWAVSSEGGTLQRIDPETNAVTDTIVLGDTPGFLVAGEGAVWVQEQGDGTVARIDPATREVAGRTAVGENLKWGDIDTGDGKVWLRTTDDQTFVVIDAQTAEILARVGRPEGSGALRYTPEGIWTSAHDVHTLTWWSEGSE
ncbi:YncE family protein [Alteraurantiacibacter aquimixticola]|uniref:YncE family protein n=1 Tax=Alteraurantiacibacter aquimixticola TaxID=2489173 RepID=A0A4V4U8F7_9SPHN|nr:YncE family protein [Alteraurantiacibacter aquimixticola]TIX49830.1 YncE family protein [Alteraurantiacibacter aquimixticola]